MESAIGLVCFVLMIAAQGAAVTAVHGQRQTREAHEISYWRAPVNGLRLPDVA